MGDAKAGNIEDNEDKHTTGLLSTAVTGSPDHTEVGKEEGVMIPE